MRSSSVSTERMLAIDPSNRGFGFVVMEGPECLIDWGEGRVSGDKSRGSLIKITALIRRYRPEVIIIEDYHHKNCRRAERVRQLLRQIPPLASVENVKVRLVARSVANEAFLQSGAVTKHQVATEIAARFPELALRMPRVRKPWRGEDPRMSIFDVTALALAAFVPLLEAKQ